MGSVQYTVDMSQTKTCSFFFLFLFVLTVIKCEQDMESVGNSGRHIVSNDKSPSRLRAVGLACVFGALFKINES